MGGILAGNERASQRVSEGNIMSHKRKYLIIRAFNYHQIDRITARLLKEEITFDIKFALLRIITNIARGTMGPRH